MNARSLCVGACALVLACGGLFSAASAQSLVHEKYALPNGMTVILHQDRSLPVVSVNTWYRVGAKEEPVGRSGFAHLFEHLMFMGTDRVPGSQFDLLMESGGGSNNASTSFDRTNYFSDGPASLLPTLLWLDADRLEDLGRTMNQQKLDLQRDVVRNERRQVIENVPYGKSELMLTGTLFPAGHPYHNEVIGTHQDLESATVQDVKDFFATFYVPKNAALVVAGDFDTAQTKALIAEQFGTIAPGVEPTRNTPPPVVIEGEKRITTVDAVQITRLTLAYLSPSAFTDGDAEMDLLAAVLAQGKSSRLYKRLVLDEELAVDVSSYQQGAVLQSVFRIDVMVRPGVDTGAVLKAVDEELARLLKEGVTAEELGQRQATVELAKLASLQSVRERADKLNEYEYFYGEPDSLKRDLDRYRNATPASVLKWAKDVVRPDRRVLLTVLPESGERAASARDTRPTDFAPSTFTPEAAQTFTLSGGVPVMFWPRPGLGLTSVSVVFAPGSVLDAKGGAGLSELASQMLVEGNSKLDSVAFGDAVQSLGAVISPGVDHESAAVSMTVVSRNIGPALDLFAGAVREPRMEQSDFDRVKALHIEDLRQQSDNPANTAARVASRLLFGADHPYGWPESGTIATVEPATLDAVKSQYKKVYNPAHATILAAGDMTPEQARKELDRAFAGWKGAGSVKPVTPANLPAARPDGMRIAIVDRPGAVQTVVRFATPAPAVTDERRVQLRLINEMLGGMFTSRLNQNLREKNGYTYGARSQFAMLPSTGMFTAGASVRADVTGASIREFLAEFDRLATNGGDISEEEVVKARSSLSTEVVQQFAGVSGVLTEAAGLIPAGLGFDTVGKDVQAMNGVTAAQLNKLANEFVNPRGGVLVLVGDKATVLEQIKDLGLPAPIFVDAEGNEVK